jgi:hypothetical protein
METMTLDQDLVVFYIPASTFPAGVEAAHQHLHDLIPYTQDRKYFGISRPEKGEIHYKAGAAELFPGEGQQLGCATLVLKKGKYISRKISNFMQDIPAIGRTFQEMLETENLDPEGYCVEWYVTQQDVLCMIRLAD